MHCWFEIDGVRCLILPPQQDRDEAAGRELEAILKELGFEQRDDYWILESGMQLKLTREFSKKLRSKLIQWGLDALDGTIEFPEELATGLEELAAEIRKQNRSQAGQ